MSAPTKDIPRPRLAETVTQMQAAMRGVAEAATRAMAAFQWFWRVTDAAALRERRAKLGGMAETAANNPAGWVSTMCIVWMHGECLSDAAHLDCHCHCHQKGTR